MAKGFSPDTGASLTTSLHRVYLFDGNSTEEISADSGTDTNISYSAGDGKIVQGAAFNGTSSEISVPSTVFSRTYNEAWSIQFWIKYTAAGAQEVFNNLDSGTSYRGLGIAMNSTTAAAHAGEVCVSWLNTNGSNECIVYSSTSGAFDDGNWQHVVITHSGTGTAAGFKIYRNGSSVTVGTDRDTLNATTVSSLTAYFGHARYGASNFLNASLDEFYIWTKELSATEVSDLYNSGSGNQYRELASGIKHLQLLGIGK